MFFFFFSIRHVCMCRFHSEFPAHAGCYRELVRQSDGVFKTLTNTLVSAHLSWFSLIPCKHALEQVWRWWRSALMKIQLAPRSPPQTGAKHSDTFSPAPRGGTGLNV